MKFYPFTLSFLCCLSNILTAQVEKQHYQTIAVGDSTKQINFNFSDSCEVIHWYHESKIMIETKACMDVKNRELLNGLMNDGRYDIVSDSNAVVKTLKFARTRSPIKNTQGQILNENISIRIYVPQDFILKKSVAYKVGSEAFIANKQ